MDVFLFILFALIAVVCGINVVVQTHPITSALSLIGVLGSLAVLYLLLGLLAYFVQRVMPGSPMVHFGGFKGGTAIEVGRALFTQYLLPFEVTSVLILIAILGAIVLARKELD